MDYSVLEKSTLFSGVPAAELRAALEETPHHIRLFMSALERQEEWLEFDAVLVSVFLEKVVVSGTKKDVRVRFILMDGSEWEA